jgi:general secretion pathway protein A
LPGAEKNLLLNYFNLRDQPFGVTPDPRYLFLTKTHREALEGLLYGIRSGLGFIALTAEPGMGKTTLLRMALNRLGNSAKTVFLFQSITNPTELFRALLIDLGEKDPPGTLIDLEMRLNEILLRANDSGQRVVVVLDEAQNLDDSVLEAIRMLSNFETSSHKLLQVILCGQQQLADTLAAPELVQLRQRISIFATLKPLSRSETAAYIVHRLKVAGYGNSTPLFTPEAVSLIAHYGDGIPRNINNFCFNSLSAACASGKKVIDAEVVREVIVDLGLEGSKFADPTDDLGWQEATIGKPAEDMDWEEAAFVQPAPDPGMQETKFAEPSDELGRQAARFAELTEELRRQGTRFAETADEPGPQRARFAELSVDPVVPEAKFSEPSDELRRRDAGFAERTDQPGRQEETLAEPADELNWRGARFVEPADDQDWRGARFAKPIKDSESDEDPFDESDRSEQRETSPALRVALIATLLCATALAVVAWNLSRSGVPLVSQVTSWFHNSPPANNPSQVQPPASPQAPAPPQPDPSAKTSRRRRDKFAAQAPFSAQEDSPQPSDEGSGERSGASRITVPNGGVTVVGARQGQSVASICVERFKGCTPALLDTIVGLNPGIKDPDHLEAGQRVFVPVADSLPQQYE